MYTESDNYPLYIMYLEFQYPKHESQDPQVILAPG